MTRIWILFKKKKKTTTTTTTTKQNKKKEHCNAMQNFELIICEFNTVGDPKFSLLIQ